MTSRSSSSEYNSDSDAEEPVLKKSRISNQYSLNSGKDDVAKKIAISCARMLIGLSSKNQVLNKNIISKILDAENEKGSKLQFKKHVLPILKPLVKDIFNYEIIELPSTKPNKRSKNANNDRDDSNSRTNSNTNISDDLPYALSDDYILVNKLDLQFRALNYKFLSSSTKPISDSIKDTQSNKESNSSTLLYGENLPKPTSSLVQNGIMLLIICIVLIHDNNILQSDLLNILKKKVGLKWKEKQSVSILGNRTMGEFIQYMGKQEYLERELTSTSTVGSGGGVSNRSLNSKNAKHEDSTLIVRLGRRCIAEWSLDQFVELFRQVMTEQWTDELQESAIFTIKSVWSQ